MNIKLRYILGFSILTLLVASFAITKKVQATCYPEGDSPAVITSFNSALSSDQLSLGNSLEWANGGRCSSGIPSLSGTATISVIGQSISSPSYNCQNLQNCNYSPSLNVSSLPNGTYSVQASVFSGGTRVTSDTIRFTITNRCATLCSSISGAVTVPANAYCTSNTACSQTALDAANGGACNSSSACTAWACNSGYQEKSDGSGCVAIPSCAGPVPDPNSSLCAGSDQNLTQSVPKTLVPACNSNKCIYTCNSPNYQYTGSLIPGAPGYCAPAPVPVTGTVNVSAKYSDNSACTASWTITGGVNPISGSGSGGSYPGQPANQNYIISVSSPSGATVSPSAAQYLSANGTITFNIGCGNPPPPAGGASFTCSITPGSQTINPGSGTSYTLSLNPSGGWTGSANVSITGAPANVAYSGPNSLSNVNSSGVINVTSQSSAAAGQYSVNAILTQTNPPGTPDTANCSAPLIISGGSCNVCSGTVTVPPNATCSAHSNCKDFASGSCSDHCTDFVCTYPYIRSGNTCVLPASRLSINPVSATIQTGGQQTFCAFRDGSTPATANWSISPNAPVTSSNLTGVNCITLTASGVGAAGIHAVDVSNGDSADATLTIGGNPPCVATLEMKPGYFNNATNIGGKFPFTVNYGCREGSELWLTDETEASTWTSSTSTVATVSNTPGTKGMATGVSYGRTTIKATFDSPTGPVTASAPLTVTDTIHSTCTNDPVLQRLCITVAGPGPSVCDSTNSNNGWRDCNTSAFCADIGGVNSCVWGYWRPAGNDCQACGGNGPHKACVGNSCVSISGPGANSCNSSADCGPAAPSLNFQVNPSSGQSPLSSTLTATLVGGLAPTTNYSFWWDCNDPGTSVAAVTAACGAPNSKLDAVPSYSQSVPNVYSANSTAKVIVENGSYALEARKSVSVTPPAGCSPGQIRPFGTCAGTSCVITDACGASACSSDADCNPSGQADCTLTATPSIISPGGSSKLTWSCVSAVSDGSCSLKAAGSSVELNPSGTKNNQVGVSVAPSKSTIYNLICQKGAVSVSANVNLKVFTIQECNPNDPTCKK